MVIRLIDSYYVEAVDKCYYHYQADISYNDIKSYEEIQFWLAENMAFNEYGIHAERIFIQSHVHANILTLIFDNKESAMAFVLRFG